MARFLASTATISAREPSRYQSVSPKHLVTDAGSRGAIPEGDYGP
jgi:hypothetical protein